MAGVRVDLPLQWAEYDLGGGPSLANCSRLAILAQSRQRSFELSDLYQSNGHLKYAQHHPVRSGPTVACRLARVSSLRAESYTYLEMGFPAVRESLLHLRVPLRPVLHRLLSVR